MRALELHGLHKLVNNLMMMRKHKQLCGTRESSGFTQTCGVHAAPVQQQQNVDVRDAKIKMFLKDSSFHSNCLNDFIICDEEEQLEVCCLLVSDILNI